MTIAVEGIQVIANHGVYTEERVHGNIFQVDVYLETQPNEALRSDNLSDTINYKEVYDHVLTSMQTPKMLLEKLAYQIASELLYSYPQVSQVKIKVAKLRPRYMEQCEKAYVELVLSQEYLKGNN